MTSDELQQEAAKLPPALRVRFESPAGQRDLLSAMVDKRLLAQEARRRKLGESPEVRRQVEELEERLVVQALLAEEERRAAPPTEAELRAAYEASKGELGQAARVQVRRILAASAAGAAAPELERARKRAERFLSRLRAGESAEKVARDGEGAERERGGDLGFLVEGSEPDPAHRKAVAALNAPRQWSPVVAVREGFAVFQLLERRPGRTPSFEEVRGEVANRLLPQRKRKQFDELLARLRASASVEVALPDAAPGTSPGDRR